MQSIHMGLTTANPINQYQWHEVVCYCPEKCVSRPAPAWQISSLPEGKHLHLYFLPPLFLTSGLVLCSTARLEWAEIC